MILGCLLFAAPVQLANVSGGASAAFGRLAAVLFVVASLSLTSFYGRGNAWDAARIMARLVGFVLPQGCDRRALSGTGLSLTPLAGSALRCPPLCRLHCVGGSKQEKPASIKVRA